MAEIKKFPNLRFKGFTDDWEQRKLINIIKKSYTGLTGKSKSDFGHGQAKYITYLNVHDNAVADPTGIDQIEIDSTQNTVNKNDLLFTTSSEVPEEVAYNSVWPVDEDNVYLNSFCFAITPQTKIVDSFFLSYYLRSPKMRKAIYPLAQGISRFNISKKNLLQLSITIPALPEQNAIYKLIRLVEQLIDLQQRKLQKLQSLKKYLTHNMLTRKGNPKIRFNNFTNQWQPYKFGELFKKSKQKNNLSYSKDQVISVATMTWKKAPEDSTDKYMKTYNVMRIGDIAFEGHKNKNFVFGRFIENTLGNGIVSHIFDVYRPLSTHYDLSFWKYYINSEAVMHEVLRKSTTSARMMNNLVESDVRKQVITIPSYSETVQIGRLLDNVDSYTNLQTKKLDKYQYIKKFLLQQMFI